MLDFGNVRLVGMTQSDLQNAIELRVGRPNGQLFILPDDIIAEHRESVRRQRDVGERLRRARRADRPLPRAGERAGLHRDLAGLRRLRRPQPDRQRAAPGSLRPGAVKQFKIRGTWSFEFRVEMLNALQQAVLQPGVDRWHPARLDATDTSRRPAARWQRRDADVNALAGSSVDSFRLTELLGDNQARIIQLIWRVRW